MKRNFKVASILLAVGVLTTACKKSSKDNAKIDEKPTAQNNNQNDNQNPNGNNGNNNGNNNQGGDIQLDWVKPVPFDAANDALFFGASGLESNSWKMTTFDIAPLKGSIDQKIVGKDYVIEYEETENINTTFNLTSFKPNFAWEFLHVLDVSYNEEQQTVTNNSGLIEGYSVLEISKDEIYSYIGNKKIARGTNEMSCADLIALEDEYEEDEKYDINLCKKLAAQGAYKIVNSYKRENYGSTLGLTQKMFFSKSVLKKDNTLIWKLETEAYTSFIYEKTNDKSIKITGYKESQSAKTTGGIQYKREVNISNTNIVLEKQ